MHPTSASLSIDAPPRDGPRPNLLGSTRQQLEAMLAEMGEKRFRAAQVLKWIHRHHVTDFAAMTDLGKSLRARLEDAAQISAPAIEEERISRDGTRKWLLRVDAANRVEMVFIPDEPRGTLCISSQAGCALNCTFCHTARQGFGRNLSAAEIVAQLWAAMRLVATPDAPGARITNVVLMGMGEPLLNFDNVVAALELMLDDNAYGLARRRVTLSTAGVVPKIDALKERCPVSLAVSLHAPNDALRDRLVPINRHYPIAELLAACRRYIDAGSREKITFEYVMLDGVNDTLAHARELARLLRDMPAKVNLIPFNPFPDSGYRRSPPAVIDAFRDVLLAADVMTITRKTRGDDIDAACGQLAGSVRARGRRPSGERTVRGASARSTGARARRKNP